MFQHLLLLWKWHCSAKVTSAFYNYNYKIVLFISEFIFTCCPTSWKSLYLSLCWTLLQTWSSVALQEPSTDFENDVMLAWTEEYYTAFENNWIMHYVASWNRMRDDSIKTQSWISSVFLSRLYYTLIILSLSPVPLVISQILTKRRKKRGRTCKMQSSPVTCSSSISEHWPSNQPFLHFLFLQLWQEM